MSEALFPLPTDAYAVTSDDCYTPRWVFDAMGLEFDLDVAAPPGGPWHVPCKRYYTATDDGLAQPWDGLVWCNPPYSRFSSWAARFAAHDRMALMGICLPETRWFPTVFSTAEAVALISCDFSRPDGKTDPAPAAGICCLPWGGHRARRASSRGRPLRRGALRKAARMTCPICGADHDDRPECGTDHCAACDVECRWCHARPASGGLA